MAAPDNSFEIMEKFFEKDILISPDILAGNLNEKINLSLIQKIGQENDLMVITLDYTEILSQDFSLVDWFEIDHYRVGAEKHLGDESYHDLYQSQLKHLKSVPSSVPLSDFSPLSTIGSSLSPKPASALISDQGKVEVVFFPEHKPKKYEVPDFTNLFISRYRFLENLLRNHQELRNIMTIKNLIGKRERELVSLIGVIEEISLTKNENYLLTIEDLTGKIKVLLSKNNLELLNAAKELTVDEVIGVSGYPSEKMFFAENIVWPDVPSTNETKKSPLEEYAVFLSDLHLGSKVFLKDDFEKFIRWINAEMGNEEQKEAARKVKYIFIAGDIVDGIGVYPNQEEELEIKDIFQQYHEFARLITQIPKDKQVIICPGNHDCIHLAEPQPVFYKDYAAPLFQLPNITLITNPGMVNIGKTKDFSGFDILMYHGYSFDYYIANVEFIRSSGGYQRADLIMKLLLKKRHLAPSFKSTPYLPAHKEDPLLIRKIPDFFVTGHIHYSKVANYKNVTMISGSCWQAKTSFQEKLGHEPEPGRVPLVNLKTREVKVLKFV